MSLLLAFQGAPPAEPDFIIQVLAEVPEEELFDLGFTSELIEDVIVAAIDDIYYLLAETPDEIEDLIGEISHPLFDADEPIVNIFSLGEEDFPELDGTIDNTIEPEDAIIFYIESTDSEEEKFEGSHDNFLIEEIFEDNQNLESFFEEDEVSGEDLINPDFIEEVFLEPLEFLFFISDEGEEEEIIPDGWTYETHSPFDDEPIIPPAQTDIYFLPFLTTVGKLKTISNV